MAIILGVRQYGHVRFRASLSFHDCNNMEPGFILTLQGNSSMGFNMRHTYVLW